MSDRTSDLIEANKRGLLTGQIKTDFDEAVNRGFITLPGQQVSPVDEGIPQPDQRLNPDVPAGGEGPAFPIIEAKQEPTLGEKVIGAGEAALALGTGATSGALGFVAGAVPGIIGEATGLLEKGEGQKLAQEASRALTFEPRTEVGKEITGDITQALGVLPPVGLGGLSKNTIKRSAGLSGNAKKALNEAAPSIKQIKSKVSGLYKELDKSGVKVKSEVFSKFVGDLNKKVNDSGFDVDLHPDSAAVMRRLNKDVGTAKSFSELNILRQIASDAAGSIKPKDARIGNIILKKIDSGIDKLAESAGRDSKGARQLWRRAKVAEAISGMVEGAGLAASGLENGLRIEARKILRSPKKSRGFTAKELKALRDLDQGSTAGNAAKFLGKFGISEGKATSMLGAAVGGQIGNQLAGGAGAVTALTLGQIAKTVSQKLTSGKARFADELVRAGGDGRAITRAYLKNTPASKRRLSELTELLLDPSITPESISKLNFKLKLVDDAKFFANAIKEKSRQSISKTVDAQRVLSAVEATKEEDQ